MTDDHTTGRPTLQIIIGSTRPGRVGKPIAEWVYDVAEQSEHFDVELVDLAEIDLPIFNEPNHPRFSSYVHQHTMQWSATIARGDAYVFVVPEYNYGFSAAVKNAIDYLWAEWQYKPVAFVSYGGVSGGTRAAQMLKQVVTALNMMPIVEAVPIPFVRQFLPDPDSFVPSDTLAAAARGMVDSLARWEPGMRKIRMAD